MPAKLVLESYPKNNNKTLVLAPIPLTIRVSKTKKTSILKVFLINVKKSIVHKLIYNQQLFEFETMKCFWEHFSCQEKTISKGKFMIYIKYIHKYSLGSLDHPLKKTIFFNKFSFKFLDI